MLVLDFAIIEALPGRSWSRKDEADIQRHLCIKRRFKSLSLSCLVVVLNLLALPAEADGAQTETVNEAARNRTAPEDIENDDEHD